MKKAIAILLCMSFVIGMFALPTVAAEQIESTEGTAYELSDSEAEALVFLQAVKAVEDLEQADYTKNITRRDYAHILAKLLNIEETGSTILYFTDVKDDGYINSLAERGIFLGSGNAKFEPDEYITVKEMIITGLRVSGYDELYKVMGANDGIMMQVARKAGLDVYTDINKPVTNIEAIAFLSALAKVNILEPKTINTEGVSDFTDVDTPMVMTVARDLYYAEGKVTANKYTSIYGESNLDDSQIEVAATVYDSAVTDAYSYIGQNVNIYYEYNDKMKNGNIIAIYAPEQENEKIVIDAKNIQSYSMKKLTYYDEKSSRNVTLELSTPSVIYNGKYEEENHPDLFDFEVGTVTIYGNGENKYDVAIIEEIRNLTVINNDWSRGVITTDATEEHLKNMDIGYYNDNDVYIKTTTADIVLNMYELTKGTHISVIASLDNELVEIYACTDVVSGTLSAISAGRYTNYVVNNNSYRFVGTVPTNASVKPGDNVRITLDAVGNAAGIEVVSNSPEILHGYVYGSEVEKSFATSIKVKIFNELGSHIVVDFAKNVKLDGKTLKKDVAFGKISTAGQVNKQLIRYKLNNDGELNYIDTAATDLDSPSAGGEMNTLHEICPMPEVKSDFYYYSPQWHAFGGMDDPQYPVISGETKVIMVPKDDEVHDESKFGVQYYQPNDVFIGNQYQVALYNTDFDRPYADYVLYKDYENYSAPYIAAYFQAWGNLSMVDSVEKVLGEDGVSVYEVRAYRYTEPIVLRLRPDCEITGYPDGAAVSVDKLSPGDLIRTTEDLQSMVSSMTIVYDYNEDTKTGQAFWSDGYKPSFTTGMLTNYNSLFAVGNVLDIYRGENDNVQSLIKVAYKGDVKEFVSFKPSLIKIVVYDSALGKVYVGSTDDISDATIDGVGDDIFIYKLSEGMYYRNLYLWK